MSVKKLNKNQAMEITNNNLQPNKSMYTRDMIHLTLFLILEMYHNDCLRH